jgi:protein involved in polysaccharide export with SLBB domain
MPEILLLTPRQFKVYVLGAVKFPGAYTASPFLRASDLIQKAGGIIPFGAQHRIELKELGGATLTADLVKFEQTGDFRYNPRIETGMVIFVPLSKQIVRVRGALQGAGLTAETVSDTSVPIVEQTYDLKEGETFLDLVLRAGGPTSQADLRRCYIERPSGSSLERTEVDLYEILREGETAHNPTLRPGDVVVVPFLSHQVYVVGEVSKPGSFALSPGYTVTDYIGLAGGPTLDADLGGTRVIRADGQELSSQDDPVIRYGDTILVPVRAARTWQGFISIASVLTSMILSFLALTR